MAKIELDAQRVMLNREGILSKFVFADTDTGFTRQKHFRKAWNRYCEHNKMSKITPYELRHTYGSINDEMPDVLVRSEPWNIIRSLKGKTTIILMTYYMEEAELLSDRIAIMKSGKLLFVGTSDEIKLKAGVDSFEDAFVKLATEGI